MNAIQYKECKENKKWILHWRWAKDRCTRVNARNYDNYGGKGVKFLLTLRQIHIIWFRDKAHLLKQASLDRIDNHIGYEFFNCRFIEHNFNCGKDKVK